MQGDGGSPANYNGSCARRGQRFRRFTFTLNNYTREELDAVHAYPAKAMVCGLEVGDCGTPHMQGAVLCEVQVSLSQLKAGPFKRAHIEKMMGSWQQNYDYCTKQDRNAFVKGTVPEPGKRNDLTNTVKLVKDGSSLKDLVLDPDDSHAVAVVKFSRGLTVVRNLLAPVRDPSKPPFVIWLWGETGTGKTRAAIEYARVVGADAWISNGGLQWFDGYVGQRVAILDDLRNKHLVGTAGFSFLLRLLDRYPFEVPYKGGYFNWAPECIIITSAYSPSECFETRKAYKPEDFRQLTRRISCVIECRAGQLGNQD